MPDESVGDLGFSFRYTKTRTVMISRFGEHIVTLRGDVAREFRDDVASIDFAAQQLLMAQLTGNYKRGNERVARNHPRNRE